MTIEYLADHPEFVETLAGWHHEEWGYLRPGDTVETRTKRIRDACGRGEIPSVFVALSDDVLLGSAALIAHDMDTRMELSPWLASVFVAPEHRGQGIASALVQRVVTAARAVGVERLFLFTSSAETLYARLGWSEFERMSYRGDDIVVMALDLDD